VSEKRCAIYTRKSTEEGLDQEFNSLDAQRDAGEAYIRSQAHEGWKLVRKNYDDGGFSGGNLKRPALKELLEDVRRGNVDIIIVYKIDRLTRSLMDFSKIMDILDASETSFAAVTQQFNTTTSMGRLTLNVLLSFAQFEREITGERIRDKIAASKKKGMWTGGPPPLGYDIVEKKLIPNKVESKQVQHIFKQYLELGNVTDLVVELNRQGLRNKKRVNKKGQLIGGAEFKRSAVYLMLQNNIYRGKVAFKSHVYDGLHRAIISEETWESVQQKLSSQRKGTINARRAKVPMLLKGLLFDSKGRSMYTTSSVKHKNRRYPYYVSASHLGYRKPDTSEVYRVPAPAIEELVCHRVALIMRMESPEDVNRDLVKQIVNKVTVHKNIVELDINHHISGVDVRELENSDDEVVTNGTTMRVRIRATLRRRDKKLVFVSRNGYEVTCAGKPDTTLVKNVVTAWKWREELELGKVRSVRELSRSENCSEGYIRRLLPLAYLAPDIVESILDGKQPPSLDLRNFTAERIPLSWETQHKLLGYTF
jgi:DNA invertase Pin-like site-specific DNA recombinase